jgi:hypothetical protein
VPYPNVGPAVASAWNAKVGTKPSDNVFNASPLARALKGDGFEKKVDGGNLIEMSLEISENPNAGFIAPTGTISTEVSETFDAAIYEPRLHASAVVIPWTDSLRNSGDAAKFPFKDSLFDNQEKTCIKQLNRAFYSDGSSPFSIDGLGKLISANSSAYVVGSINPLTYSWWRNQSVVGTKASTAYDNLRNAFRTVYSNIARGDEGDAATHALTTLDIANGYESILIANERYQKSGSKQQSVNGGFDNDGLYFKKTHIVGDEDCSSGDAFFINAKFLKLVYYAWMSMQKPVDPSNQFVTSYKVGTYGQLCTNNRRKLGRVHSIT